jgi:hypothetical protein
VTAIGVRDLDEEEAASFQRSDVRCVNHNSSSRVCDLRSSRCCDGSRSDDRGRCNPRASRGGRCILTSTAVKLLSSPTPSAVVADVAGLLAGAS